MEKEEIYQKIIDKFACQNQIIIAIEEMSELQKTLCKYLRFENFSFDNIIEEIADVRIMIEQLEMMFDCDLLVLQKKEEKLKRIKERYLK